MANYIELLAAHDRLEAECDRLKAEVAELVGALDDLMAEQNGPPLCDPRHEKAWQRAMDNATAILSRVRSEPQS